jgi:accessory gene regulator B
MLEQLAEHLTARLIANGTVQEEKAALYSFGFLQGIRTILETLLLLGTGILLGQFWQCVVILFVFAPMRIYAGGYHAGTAGECAWKTWLLLLAVLLYLKFVPGVLLIQIGVLCVTAGMIWIAAPIEDEHKPLKEYEVKKYRRKSAKFFFLNLALFLLGYGIGVPVLSRCIAMSMAMLIVIMTAGIIKNERRKRSNGI